MKATYELKWGYYIKVYGGKYPTCDVITVLKWENISFDLYCKYTWYFEYRYALLRIQYPKFLIEKNQLRRELNADESRIVRQNKIVGKKRTITKYKNKLELARINWSSLFPIEDDLMYQRAVDKIRRLESELDFLENT